MNHAFVQYPFPEGDYRFMQAGFVVDDAVAAASRWALVLGVGPWQVLGPIRSSYFLRGEPAELQIRIAVAQAGPLQIELIEELSTEPSVYSMFRGARAGFHQLCTMTTQYEATRAHYAELGYEELGEFVVPQRVVYVDTFAEFGFYTEIVEAIPPFVAALEAHAKTCAEWDGVTDPVRIVTRDGYRVP